MDIRLYNTTYLIFLTGTDAHDLNFGGALGMPQAQRVYSEAWRRGFSPLTAIDYRQREATLSLQLRATSQDDLITTFRQIEEVLLDVRDYYTSNGLEGDKAVLSVQRDGQTYPIEYDILDGELDASAVFDAPIARTAPRQTAVPLTLRIKPFGRTQQLSSVTSGTLNNGGGTGNTNAAYTLTAPNGDVPAPVRWTFQSAAGDTFRRIIAGRKSIGNMSATDTFQFAFNCEPGTGPGYTVTSGQSVVGTLEASAHNSSVARIASAVGTASQAMTAFANIEITSGLPNYYGRYRAYLRVDRAPASMIQSARLTYDGASGEAITAAAVDPTPPSGTTADYLMDMGVVEMGPAFSPLDQTRNSFKMRLSYAKGQMDSATHWDADCLYLLPIEETFDGELSAAAPAQDQLVVDALQPQGVAYTMDASGDLQAEIVTPFTNTLFTAQNNLPSRWFFLSVSTTNMNHNLTDQGTIKLAYFPQYVLGRTSAS